MNYSLVDAAGLTLSALSYVPLLVAPGMALAFVAGWRRSKDAEPALLSAVVVGLAALPVIDSLAAHVAGVASALVLNLILAAGGCAVAARMRWRPRLSRTEAILLAVWFLLVVAEWIDFDVGGQLHQPFLALDMVKHAATVQAIHDTGAPSVDPFFLRSQRVSYYYFFYTLAALSQQLCGGLADARAAVGGLVFWTGIGLYGLIRFVIARAGLAAGPWSRRVGLTTAAVMAIGGLDVLPALRMGLVGGLWLPDPIWWNEQVTGPLESLLWVPHHVSALIASLAALMALSEETSEARLRRVAFAGVCFASALGLSVWVTLGAVATCGGWLASLALRRRWRMAGGLLLAGGVAVALASFQLLDLKAGRSDGLFPIALTVRKFSPVEAAVPPGPLMMLARFVCLPVNYFAGFGLLASGSLLFWRERPETPGATPEFARVLAIAAVCGLGLGAFLKSTLYSNDLGWRVVLFPLAAGVAWTVSGLERRFAAARVATLRPALGQLTGVMWGLAIVGAGTTLYAVVQLRTYASLPMRDDWRIALDARTQRSLRDAYGWANAHLPSTAVLQHSPVRPRVYAFGLYSRNRVAVADAAAGLYGAAQDAVNARVAALIPVFTQTLSAADVRRRAAANGVDALVVDTDDRVWRDRSAWVWTTRPIYAADRVRIIKTTDIGSRP